MKKTNRLLTQAAFAALVGTAALAVTATAAEARIVCNENGACWHVRNQNYAYPAGFGITVHPDNWRWRDRDHYRWREHEGRGYWRNNAWVTF